MEIIQVRSDRMEEREVDNFDTCIEKRPLGLGGALDMRLRAREA